MAGNLRGGLANLVGVFAEILGPAQEFMATGSKSAAAWAAMKGVLHGKVLGPLSLISGAAVTLLALMKKLVTQSELLGKGMSKIRELETVKTQFQPLLGGATQAQRRLEELYEFAARTPFQLSEIAEASKTLEVLSRGAISTGKSLRMVGDAAAVSGQSMQTVAFWTGRLYDALQAGRPIGEAANRLMEMGLVTGKTRAKIEDMNKAGVQFNQIWAEFEKGMEKTKGGMEELSKTLGGLESTLLDVRQAFEAKFASNFLEGEKIAVKNSITLLEAMEEPIGRLGGHLAGISNKFEEVKQAILKMATAGGMLTRVTNTLIDTLLGIGGGLVAAQILYTTGTILSMGKAMKGTAAAAALNTMAIRWNRSAHLGLWARIKFTIAATNQLNVVQKLGVVGAGAFAGAMRVAGGAVAFLGKMIMSALSSIGVWGWTLIAISTAFTMWSSHSRKIKETEERIKAAKDGFQEFKKQLDDSIDSMKTFADKQSSIQKTLDQMKSTRGRIMELRLEETEKGPNSTRAREIATNEAVYSDLREQLNRIFNIENNSLELSRLKTDQLRQQLEISRAISDVEFNAGMRNFNDAGKVYALVKKRQELETEVKQSAGADKGLKALEDFNRSDHTKGMEIKIKQYRDELDLLKTNAEKEKNRLIKRTGFWDVTDDRSIGGSPMDYVDKTEDRRRYGFGPKERKLGESSWGKMKELEILIERYENALLNHRKFVFGTFGAEALEAMKSEDFQPLNRIPGVKRGSNVIGMAQTTLMANENLDERQKENLQKIIKAHTNKAQEYAQAVKDLAAIDVKIGEQRREVMKGVVFHLADKSVHEAKMGIDYFDPAKRIKELNAQEKAAEMKYTAEKTIGADTRTVEALERERDALEEYKKGGKGEYESISGRKSSIEKEFEQSGGQSFYIWYRKRIRAIEEALSNSKLNEGEKEKLKQALDRVRKDKKDFEDQIERSLLNMSIELKREQARLQVSRGLESAINGGNLSNGLFGIIKEQQAAFQEFVLAEQDKLRQQGISGDKYETMLNNAIQLREQTAATAIQVEAERAQREEKIAELQFRKNKYGDREAKRELRLMELRELVVSQTAKQVEQISQLPFLQQPQAMMQAAETIQQRVRAHILGDIPAFNQVADSFRRVGAGGVAIGNNPEEILRRRMIEGQKLTNNLLQQLVNEVVSDTVGNKLKDFFRVR